MPSRLDVLSTSRNARFYPTQSSTTPTASSHDRSESVFTTDSGVGGSRSTSRPARAGSTFGARSRFAKNRFCRAPSTFSSAGGGSSLRTSTVRNAVSRNATAQIIMEAYEDTHGNAKRHPGPYIYGQGPGGARSRQQQTVSVTQGRAADDASGIDDHERAANAISETDDEWIVVVSEGKGQGRTVGVAAYQPSTAMCILTQLNDSQTYIKTVHTLSVRWPSVIIVIGSSGLSASKISAAVGSAAAAAIGGNNAASGRGGLFKVDDTLLVKTLQAAFSNSAPPTVDEHGTPLTATARATWGMDNPGVPVIAMQRRYFDAEAGEDFVKQLIVQDDETEMHLSNVHGKYYALCAVAALFKYLEVHKNWVFGNKSLRIKYLPLEGTMIIDNQSVKNLELTENLMDRNSKQSLHGLLCHCYTPMATRLLRTNILSPLTQVDVIDMRLDVVVELVQNEELFGAVRQALRGLMNIDADKIAGDILANTSFKPEESTASKRRTSPSEPAKESERKIQLVIHLRAFIKALPRVATALSEAGGAQSSLLKMIVKILGDARLQAIDTAICDTLNESALNSDAKSALASRTSRVYAIKAERKRLLDVAREIYKENISDVDDLLKDLQSKHADGCLAEIELHYATTSGFSFLIGEDIVAETMNGHLPKIFNKIGKKGKKVQFSCVELLKRNERIKQSLDEVFLLSSDVLDELLIAVREHIAVLYRCSEVVGMLDMLAGFAHVATVTSEYVRPEFTDTLAIKDGRHPVIDRYRMEESFVPNDTYATEGKTFQLITGPNMSGKTTFLKQVALLIVMSQIGSFVPASYASFRIHGALLTRLSNDDSIEGNLSTFALEMQSMAMILSGLATVENAVVIIDELGRGTSPEEGVGLAHALAEEIIRSKAFCFFATHFLDLATTLSVHPNVVVLHLETDTAPNFNSDGFQMNFTHRVRDGTTSAQNYGLEIAKIVGLPDAMLDWAKQATGKLSELEEVRRKSAAGTKLINKRKVILNAVSDLRQAFRNSLMSEDDLRERIQYIADEVVTGLTAGMSDETITNSTRDPNVDSSPPTSAYVDLNDSFYSRNSTAVSTHDGLSSQERTKVATGDTPPLRPSAFAGHSSTPTAFDRASDFDVGTHSDSDTRPEVSLSENGAGGTPRHGSTPFETTPSRRREFSQVSRFEEDPAFTDPAYQQPRHDSLPKFQGSAEQDMDVESPRHESFLPSATSPTRRRELSQVSRFEEDPAFTDPAYQPLRHDSLPEFDGLAEQRNLESSALSIARESTVDTVQSSPRVRIKIEKIDHADAGTVGTEPDTTAPQIQEPDLNDTVVKMAKRHSPIKTGNDFYTPGAVDENDDIQDDSDSDEQAKRRDRRDSVYSDDTLITE